MRLTVCLFLAGCGSFGLDPAGAWVGELFVQPQGPTDFGELLPDRQAAARRFVVSSAEDDAGIDVTDVWIEGDTGAFAIAVPIEVPRLLDPGERMGVSVRFRPADEGAYEADLVTETGDGQRQRRKLSGTGCKNRDDNQRCD